MASLVRLASCLALLAAASPDLLPLKRGIYVPVGRACRGASNADIVNYWGGRSSIGVAGGECRIQRMTRQGSIYTLHDQCRDVGSGDVIAGGPTLVTISSPTSFRMNATSYRYCGPKVVF